MLKLYDTQSTVGNETVTGTGNDKAESELRKVRLRKKQYDDEIKFEENTLI